MPVVTIICGPTASGKSGLACKLAAEIGGTIINCDSMQVYGGLEVLTACPTQQEKCAIPHLLYNYVPVGAGYNVKRYVDDVAGVLPMVTKPIFVGGTGLYLKALLDGLSVVPDITQDTRHFVDKLLESQGIAGAYCALQKMDPDYAQRLKPNDVARITRALAVVYQTGQSLMTYNRQKQEGLLAGYLRHIIFLKPQRDALYRNCNMRFVHMVNSGALEEVRACVEQGVNSSALGFAELRRYLAGELSMDEAITQAQTKTRQYAKRQITWFSNQL